MWHLIPLTLSFLCYLSAINRGDAAPVSTGVVEATKYLARFGYLDQKYQNSSYSAASSPETFKKAIEDFQSFAGLKKTGKLDTDTTKWMNKTRCGVPDRIRPSSSSTRQKRFALEGSKWPKKQLSYTIKEYTTDMSKSDVDREIARAFQMWADVTDLTFVRVNNESADVDIDVLFVSGEHGNCPPFKDDVYAHATYPINGGDAHFNEGKTWTLNSDKGTNLFQIATHEFGHSLGLEHTNVAQAVMYPYYKYSCDFKLDNDDIEGIQELYGENQWRKSAIELKATKEELGNANSKLEAQIKATEKELKEIKMSVGNLLSELKEELAKIKMELEKKDANISKTVNDLSIKLNVNSQRFGYELKAAEDNLRKELRTTSNDLETTTTNLAPATPIYFGGVPDRFALAPGASATDSSFSGCIGDTTINGKLINYASSTGNQGASVAKCPLPDALGGSPLKPKRIDDEDSSSIDPVPSETIPSETVPSEKDPIESLPYEPVTQPSEPIEPEPTTEAQVITTTTEAIPVTTPIPETTTIPMGQCRLPVQPADDPDVDDNSGTRFGNVKFSRHEYNTLPGRHSQKSELSVEFKTSEPDGIIFYAAENRHIDYTALYLKDGKLHFSFNSGLGPALLSSPETYNDDQWHTVMFNRDRQNGTLVVDDLVVAEGSSPGNTQTINVDQPHYVGGISPEVLNNARHNFKGVEGGLIGCLRNFRASSRPAGEPSYIEGTEPCSSKVETGSFFAVQGGYIKAVENFRVGLDIDISMEIKPRSTSGILMSVHGRRDFLLLQMVNGALIFSVDNGRSPIVATYIPPHEHHMCDGKWHYVQAIKEKNVLTLSVDNVFVEPGIGVAGVSSADTNNPLFIGGHPNPSKPRGIKTQEQFVGCIRNLNINRNLLRFGSTEAIGSVTATTCPTI